MYPMTDLFRDLEQLKPLNNRYKLEKLLGKGGFGRVYRARDTVLERDVAVKIFMPNLMIGPDELEKTLERLRKRFDREIALTAQLASRTTVKVLDRGAYNPTKEDPQQTEDRELGVPFMVMEYIQGKTLQEYISEQPNGVLSRLDTTLVIMQIAQSLNEAHVGHGMIHRDLKTANIMVVDHKGDDIQIKVMDFGIAKAFRSGGGFDASLTATKSILMSPGYAAPEQVGCYEGKLGPYTDLYSLGIVAYECLTGLNPCTGEPASALRFVDQVELMGGLFSPESLEIQEEDGGPLTSIINRLMRKIPAERYQSCAELIEDLKRIEVGGAKTTEPPAPVATPGLQDLQAVKPAGETERIESAGGQVARSHSTRDLSYEAGRLASGEFAETQLTRPGMFDPLEDKKTIPVEAVDSARMPRRELPEAHQGLEEVSGSSAETEWLSEDLGEVDTQRQIAMERPSNTKSSGRGVIAVLVVLIVACVGVLAVLLVDSGEPEISDAGTPAVAVVDIARLTRAEASAKVALALESAREVNIAPVRAERPEVTRSSPPTPSPRVVKVAKPAAKKIKKTVERSSAPAPEKKVVEPEKPVITEPKEAAPEKPIEKPVVAEKKPEPVKDAARVASEPKAEPEKKPEPKVEPVKKKKRPTAHF